MIGGRSTSTNLLGVAFNSGCQSLISITKDFVCIHSPEQGNTAGKVSVFFCSFLLFLSKLFRFFSFFNQLYFSYKSFNFLFISFTKKKKNYLR
jgi:hypothetical protein